MILYVLGFAFTPNNQVVLIKKTKPAWQAGKLNGVGGKVEPGENLAPVEAMVREFEEETGVPTAVQQWEQFAIMDCGPDVRVAVYAATLIPTQVKALRSPTEEQVKVIDWADHVYYHPYPVLLNLEWLVPLAYDVINNPEPPTMVSIFYPAPRGQKPLDNPSQDGIVDS